MQRFELVEVGGRIVERLGRALFQVRLSNGHLVVAHVSPSVLAGFLDAGTGSVQKVSADGNDGLIGREVLVKLRAFDLSSGSIISFGSLVQEASGSSEVLEQA